MTIEDLHTFAIPEWEKILILVVIFLFMLLAFFVRREMRECRDDRTELRNELDEEREARGKTEVRVAKLETLAEVPCHIPNCPKNLTKK